MVPLHMWLLFACAVCCVYFIVSSLFYVYFFLFETVNEISNNVVCATSKALDQPAHMCSLIRAFASRLSIL